MKLRGTASLEVALVSTIFVPILVIGFGMFSWINYIREMSIIEQAWSKTINSPVVESISASWDSLQFGNKIWDNILNENLQRLNDYLNRHNIIQTSNFLFQISIWRINYNVESGSIIQTNRLAQRQLASNNANQFFPALTDFNNRLNNFMLQVPAIRVNLVSIPMHYDFGLTTFGEASMINFLPERFFITYFYGISPNNERFTEAITGVLSTIGILPNFGYIAGRVIPII